MSIVIGFAILLILPIPDSPKLEIYTYSIIYTLTAIFVTTHLFNRGIQKIK
jgi:hypothetical protein